MSGGDYSDDYDGDYGYDNDLDDDSNDYNSLFDDIDIIGGDYSDEYDGDYGYSNDLDGGDEFDDLFKSVKKSAAKSTKRSIVLLRTDSWADLKRKIYYMMDIPIEYQYLYAGDVTQHKIYINGNEIDMTYKNKTLKDLENIDIYNNMNAIEIIKLEDVLFLDNMTNISLVDFRDNNMYETLTSDARNIYYYEYILKYWPMLGKDVGTHNIHIPDYTFECSLMMKLKLTNIINDVLHSCDIVVQSKKHKVIDIKELFNFVHIDDKVRQVKASYFDNVLDASITLVKVPIDVPEPNSGEHDSLFNEICIYFYIDNKLIKFRINANGNQIYQISVNNVYNKESIFNIVSPINKLIRRINDGLHYNLDDIKISSMSISNISATIDTESVDPLRNLLQLNYIRFNRRLANNIDEYIIEYFNHYDWRALLDNGVYNTYINTKYIDELKYVRRIKVIHNLTSTKILVNGLDEVEYDFYKSLFITHATITHMQKYTKNNIKSLMNKDIVLFNLKKQGSPLLYTKLCQKKNQPVMYFKEELNGLDSKTKKRLTKWWNFTTNENVYYDCPNKDKPYFTFIVGKHPLDYCLPCCGQTKHSSNDTSLIHKKDVIYEKCMINHTYIDNKMANDESKYIFNYGKSIEVDRLINIINSKMRKLFTTIYTPSSKTENYYGIGVLDVDSFVESILLCLDITYAEFVKRIVDKLRSDEFLFYRLLDGKSIRYFNDIHDFIHKLNRREIHTSSMLYEDLLYYVFGVRVLKIIDKGATVYIKHKHYDNTFKNKYIVLIKNSLWQKANNTFTKNSIYFPVCSLVPLTYFKMKEITQRIFEFESPVIVKLLNIFNTIEARKKLVVNVETKLTYKGILAFIGNQYLIVAAYFNNMHHIIMLCLMTTDKRKHHICIPIEPIRMDDYVGKTEFILNSKDIKIVREEVLSFFDKYVQSSFIVKKKYIDYGDFRIPLYDVFDSSYENPFYINYIICKTNMKDLPSKRYESNIAKSFTFIHDVKLVLADKSIVGMIDDELNINNELNTSKAHKAISKLIKHKEYTDVIYQLLSDKVFRPYMQYDFKDKLLEFNINSNEKIIIE